MSLTVESYKLVGRTYLQRLLDQTNEDCHCSNCTFCVRGKLIQAELFKNGYQTFNKDVKCWKISESANSLSVSPSDQWFFAAVLGFDKIKGYLLLSLLCILQVVVCTFPPSFQLIRKKHEFQHSLQKEFYQIW